ncbi:MAG: hypothetical protein ACE5HV_15720, partial [Acidobacteriota bacterium]
MWFLNSLLDTLIDLLLYLFRGLPPIAGLAAISVALGIGMLLVFRATSDQPGIIAVKRQIHAGIFEIRLFNDDLRAILRAQIDILRHNLTYLRLSLVPVLWMIVPLVLLIIQLQFHFGYGGLQPHQKVILEVKLRPGVGVMTVAASVRTGAENTAAAGGATGGTTGAGSMAERTSSTRGTATGNTTVPSAAPAVSLEVPAGVRIDSPRLWIPSLREIDWRLEVEEPGAYELQVRVGDETFSKSLVVSDAVVRRSPL